jgi:predicted lipoprotein with Yx(FWY)xxD motif
MRKLSTLTPILGAVIVLAACTGGGGTSASASAAVAPASSAPAEPSAEPSESTAAGSPAGSAAAGDATIAVGETDLGEIVVDGEGRTLYIFTPDVDGESTCYDGCATAWPPLIAEGEPVAGEGIEEGDLATVERTDGTEQVTYFGKPLYYVAADAAPGDTNGQGQGDKRYVIGPDGTEIK